MTEDFVEQVTFQLNLKGSIQSQLNWGLWAGPETQMEERVSQDLENAEDPGKMVLNPVSLTQVWGQGGQSSRKSMGKNGRLHSLGCH